MKHPFFLKKKRLSIAHGPRTERITAFRGVDQGDMKQALRLPDQIGRVMTAIPQTHHMILTEKEHTRKLLQRQKFREMNRTDQVASFDALQAMDIFREDLGVEVLDAKARHQRKKNVGVDRIVQRNQKVNPLDKFVSYLRFPILWLGRVNGIEMCFPNDRTGCIGARLELNVSVGRPG